MSNPLSDIRGDIAGAVSLALDEKYEVFDYLPERLNPPMVVCLPGDSYLEMVGGQDTFNSITVNNTVTVIGNRMESDNLENTEFLDSLIWQIFDGVDGIQSVSKPFELSVQNGSYLATDIKISSTLNRS